MRVSDITPQFPKIFFFDFDGVLTDNTVYVNETGQESVRCHRGDGMAINAIKKLNIPASIVSTEKNPVVSQRAKKLGIPCEQGVGNKVQVITGISQSHGVELQHACYVGNDINDLRAMSLCGLRVAPADSHPEILKIANIRLTTNGGYGVLRELLETHLELDLIELLYPK